MQLWIYDYWDLFPEITYPLLKLMIPACGFYQYIGFTQCIWIPDNVSFITHSGRVRHICVSKLTIIGSDNGLSPDRRQAIILTNAAILLIGPLGTSFSEILIEIHAFSIKKMHLKISSGKWGPFCLGLNVINHQTYPINVLTLLALKQEYCWGPFY